MRIALFIEKGKELFDAMARRKEGKYASLIFVFLGGGVGGLFLGMLTSPSVAYEDMTLSRIPACMNAVIDETNKTLSDGSTKTGTPTEGRVVGSSKGSKYHFPWCPGASQIKEENKIWFATEKDAQDAGYAKAGNCN